MRNMEVMVYWGANGDGYEVSVIQGCNLLDHYQAGNNPNDSYQPAAQNAVPLRTLRKWARETAYEMASEHGIPRYHVFEDAL